MLNIQAANVTVMVTNLDNAIKFYTEILGMTLKNRYGQHWADLEGYGLAIGLHLTDRKMKRADNLQIGLKVPDIDKAIIALAQNGVHVKKNNEDQVKLASFMDPDNNTLYLVRSDW